MLLYFKSRVLPVLVVGKHVKFAIWQVTLFTPVNAMNSILGADFLLYYWVIVSRGMSDPSAPIVCVVLCLWKSPIFKQRFLAQFIYPSVYSLCCCWFCCDKSDIWFGGSYIQGRKNATGNYVAVKFLIDGDFTATCAYDDEFLIGRKSNPEGNLKGDAAQMLLIDHKLVGWKMILDLFLKMVTIWRHHGQHRDEGTSDRYQANKDQGSK